MASSDTTRASEGILGDDKREKRDEIIEMLR
jgi:hypothetical protein